MSGTVIGTATYPVDLSDGRQVAPGETVPDVDLDHPHQRGLVTDGHLTVVEGPTARKAPKPAAIVKAAERDAEAAADDGPTTKETR